MKKCVILQNLKGITIYTGNEPQVITCKTKSGELIQGFRFKEWSIEHQSIFHRYTKINQYENHKLDLIITNNDFRILKGKKGILTD